MAKFASAARQAAGVIKPLQGNILRSVGTVRNYEQGLTRVAEWMTANRINHGDLRTLTPAQAITYLEQRGEQVGQKTLDMERQAIQAMNISLEWFYHASRLAGSAGEFSHFFPASG
ncbi:hypothetical protein QU522_10005 [Klebsiella pneumoniae subsp. pneumoniae]|nr:hypothetical protein [Klebsiella pneumoniae]WKA68942.1 hypothetical protein QU522_10005 [Klebsiella pneumoniae subsp. pneumoniae]